MNNDPEKDKEKVFNKSNLISWFLSVVFPSMKSPLNSFLVDINGVSPGFAPSHFE